MTVPRPRQPDYTYEEYDTEQFNRSKQVLAQTAMRNEGLDSMRQAVAALQLKDLLESSGIIVP